MMNLKPKHIKYIKALGFVMLLVLMVVLNNNQKTHSSKLNKSNTTTIVEINHDGITPLSAQIPDNAETTLPIKLITNINTNFLYFVNHSVDIKTEFKYIQFKKQFLSYCDRIFSNFITEFLVTARNKDIK